MGGDVDIFGVKFAQRVYGGIQPFDACPLEWGQHFEGEGRMLVAVDQFYDVHCLFSLFQLFRAHIGAYWDKNTKKERFLLDLFENSLVFIALLHKSGDG